MIKHQKVLQIILIIINIILREHFKVLKFFFKYLAIKKFLILKMFSLQTETDPYWSLALLF